MFECNFKVPMSGLDLKEIACLLSQQSYRLIPHNSVPHKTTVLSSMQATEGMEPELNAHSNPN